MRGSVFLGCSSCLEKSQRRGEVEFVHCMAKSWSLRLINMHGSLALHVLDFNWLHVGGISTILSHASCLIKTPTMYLITQTT